MYVCMYVYISSLSLYLNGDVSGLVQMYIYVYIYIYQSIYIFPLSFLLILSISSIQAIVIHFIYYFHFLVLLFHSKQLVAFARGSALYI